jgi:NADH-quinone oxidoreductase subunit B
LIHGILRLQEKIAGENPGIGGVSRPDPLALQAAPVRPGN